MAHPVRSGPLNRRVNYIGNKNKKGILLNLPVVLRRSLSTSTATAVFPLPVGHTTILREDELICVNDGLEAKKIPIFLYCRVHKLLLVLT